MPEAKFVKFLGVDRFGLGYELYDDGYVYQFDGNRCRGWIASWPAWERTLHKILVKGRGR